MARLFPDLDVIARRAVPLTPGEFKLLVALATALDDRYEVYVEPYVHGYRPDIVVLRPGVGALVIEVKDWRLDAYAPQRTVWKVRGGGAQLSPYEQAVRYRRALQTLAAGVDPRTPFPVAAAVYFHRATTAAATRSNRWHQGIMALGQDALSPERIARLMRKAQLSRPPRRALAAATGELRRHLAPPTHTIEQGQPILLTADQERLARSKPGGQKILGVAGSGKSTVLGVRAVRAYQRHGQQVLVLTYNVTLTNYLRDRISAVRASFPWSAFHIENVHRFFRAQASNLSLPWASPLDAADDPKAFRSVADRTPRYHTILIDEVQDFKGEWLRTLRECFLAEGGEFVLFGDDRQTLYARERASDGYPNTTIPGAWSRLEQSFRMHTAVASCATAFAEAFPGDAKDPVTGLRAPGYTPRDRGWVRVRPVRQGECPAASVQQMLRAEGLHPNDVAILAAQVETLQEIDVELRRQGVRTMCAFESKEERRWVKATGEQWDVRRLRRARKAAFQMNGGTLKLACVHSFKGWDVDTVVLVLRGNPHETDALVYTALTRARRRLLVLVAGPSRHGAFWRKWAQGAEKGARPACMRAITARR